MRKTSKKSLELKKVTIAKANMHKIKGGSNPILQSFLCIPKDLEG